MGKRLKSNRHQFNPSYISSSKKILPKSNASQNSLSYSSPHIFKYAFGFNPNIIQKDEMKFSFSYISDSFDKFHNDIYNLFNHSNQISDNFDIQKDLKSFKIYNFQKKKILEHRKKIKKIIINSNVNIA